MATLPLKDIVDVVVSLSPVSTVRSGFNIGLIVGKSTIISTSDRVKTYASLEEMISGGWSGTEPEYAAANLYFSQTPRPGKVAIGRWDGGGGETAVQALTACRTANYEWYAAYVCNATKAEILLLAAYVETAQPSTILFYTTADSDVKPGTAGNVLLSLKASKYKRTIGQYSTVSHAAAAIMGYAMGANTGLTNSAYTLAYKQEVGVNTETLTSSEITNIKNANGNVYISRGNSYNLFEQGVNAAGYPMDEIINLDVLTNDIQLAVMDALVANPKVPQTDEGVGILVNVITSACVAARNKGFIAPGIWNAPQIGSIATGDTLSAGFVILADTIASQSQADREARKAPPINVLIKLAGAIEHVAISIQVNR